MVLQSYLKSGVVCLLCTYSPITFAENVKTHILGNGLQILVKEDHRAPVVVNQVWYKVGSSYENEGTTGISHMLEHMMFKGTQKYPAGEFSRIMAANGASENAFTSLDYTTYFQTLERNRLRISFELEADRMRHLVFDEAEFAKEREVVLEERLMRTEDNPVNVLFEHFRATAFKTSPYQNPVIGWKSDIESFTLADLREWYERWYAPNNAVVIVVGDVQAEEVFALAEEYFGQLEPSPQLGVVKPRPEVAQLGMKRIVVKKPARLPYLLMGYKVPVLATVKGDAASDIYALELLSGVLDGGESARLSRELIRGQQVATSLSVSYSGFSRLDTLFTLGGIPTAGHSVADLEAAIRAQIERLKSSLVSVEELARVKVQIKASKVYERDSLFYQGMQIGSLVSIGLDWHIEDAYLDIVSQITPEQLQAVARKYLVEDRLTVGVLEPLPLDEAASEPVLEQAEMVR